MENSIQVITNQPQYAEYLLLEEELQKVLTEVLEDLFALKDLYRQTENTKIDYISFRILDMPAGIAETETEELFFATEAENSSKNNLTDWMVQTLKEVKE